MSSRTNPSHPRTQPPSTRTAQVHAARGLGRLIRSVRMALLRTEHVVERLTDRQPVGIGGRLSVSVVDDPTGTLRLIGVRGPLTLETLGDLADALDAIDDDGWVHLDLTDARIIGSLALDRVERLFDRLELRGVRIRIVGLDPRHPALTQQRP
jgi:anti-anti-sigma regulatory factor